MSRSYRKPWLRMESRWRGLKRAANRAVRRGRKVDVFAARMMCRMLRTSLDWTRGESDFFYGVEASLDDNECRRSAHKRVRNGYWSVRGWMRFMFRRYRDGTPNEWHVIGSRK